MVQEKLEIRGIARRDIITYIRQIGGEESYCDNSFLFLGDNWSCEVFEEESFFMFQSHIPKVHIVFQAKEDKILEEILTAFRKKTFRAGG